MFWILALAAALYLFYKWATANNDYFKIKGVPYAEPTFLLGSNGNMFLQKRSLPVIVMKMYNDRKSERLDLVTSQTSNDEKIFGIL